MLTEVRRALGTVLSCLLALTPALAQQTQSGAAPIPPQVLEAHTVFVANGGGSNFFENFSGGPDRAYNTFYKQLKEMNRYELVNSPAQADVIFEIRAIAPAAAGTDTPAYNPQVILTIREPKTNAVLWTESANVRAFGTKERRDRGFDQSVAVLVDKLAEVTGQPLTPSQTRAIASNSRMPTAAKAVIVAAIAGAVAMTAWGIHRVNNPPKLTPPHTPTFP